MTWALQAAALAETVAFDARGGASLIGFNPQVQLVPTFPAPIAPVLVLSFESDEPIPQEADGRLYRLKATVTGPNGEVVHSVDHTARGAVPEQQRPDITVPTRAQFTLQTHFQAPHPGEYTFRTEVEFIDDKQTFELVNRLFVAPLTPPS